MLQDDDRKLSKWLASRPGARYQVRKNIMEQNITLPRAEVERVLELELELEKLADRFSEGWHDGIKIDASDVMLLTDVAAALRERLARQECLSNCETCEHKKNPDGGHCYMFREAPEGVCAKHRLARQDNKVSTARGCRPEKDSSGSNAVPAAGNLLVAIEEAVASIDAGMVEGARATLEDALAGCYDHLEVLSAVAQRDQALEAYTRATDWEREDLGKKGSAREEPVAWLESEPSTMNWPLRDLFSGPMSMAYSSRWHSGSSKPNAPPGNRLTPLYTAPQPAREWVSLTEEERFELWKQTETDNRFVLMDALDAKLREKNA